ncbi:MAG: phosphonopyruvate decarboxylase [Planctomycetia bacterium]|nr:phosphonopyruvate decarboxylase [Planctomycetia bacterium]
MLNQELVFGALARHGVDFFTGVPDSYLNGFCNYALQHYPQRNIIAANEGNAIAIASGHYIATRQVPLVYMQNSGLGNAINPLASLVERRVYAIPMVLLIGWRGQPGTGDWPQHEQQGEITLPLLDVLNIPYTVLEDDDAKIEQVVSHAVETSRTTRRPYALVAPKGVMAGSKGNDTDDRFPMSREEAIETALNAMPSDTIYSATTGRATRELFFLRERRGESKACDFLNVGSMGHASSVALGIALARPERNVVCLDGDSAAILHLGAMTMVSKLQAPNFLHIVLNNGAHESVGGQPSAGLLVDFIKIAEGCGYHTCGAPATTAEELVAAIEDFKRAKRATLIDAHIHKGLRGKLPPLDFSHREAIDALIDELNR